LAIIILGLIAIGAALLLIYYSIGSRGKAPNVTSAKKIQAKVVPEKKYKTSEDGKVVYPFGQDGKNGEGGDDRSDPNTDDSDGDER
jgi:hypothetical protein